MQCDQKSMRQSNFLLSDPSDVHARSRIATFGGTYEIVTFEMSIVAASPPKAQLKCSVNFSNDFPPLKEVHAS